ncbi:MAG: hypothetical protein FWG60_00360, partial [Methanomassiliicoccaceae archaeon]|nr:hypothetical protein [Methanomassiliicoccaceae archaeon]
EYPRRRPRGTATTNAMRNPFTNVVRLADMYLPRLIWVILSPLRYRSTNAFHVSKGVGMAVLFDITDTVHQTIMKRDNEITVIAAVLPNR